MKQKTNQLLIIILMTMTLCGCPYHKHSFTGKVIDAETKDPIEGAVAVAIYHKSAMGLGAGQISSVINVREAMTNKEGLFRIPSYTTVVFPFTWQTDATFIIYKPGYGNFPHQHTSPPGLDSTNQEIYFSSGIGNEKLFNEVGSWRTPEKKILKTGIVELPKLKTREERLNASTIGVSGYRSKDLPLLYKLINEEARALAIPGRE